MDYRVIRKYGRNTDYLTGFDKEWGTVCGGTEPLHFATKEAAKAAARKARRCCMGWNGEHKVRARMDFRAV